MKTLLSPVLVALLSLTPPTPAQAQGLTTEWLTSSQFQNYFVTNIRGQGLVPTYMEAAVFHGQIYYYAQFERLNGIGWATQHGISDATFAQRDAEYRAQGYRLFYHQRFTGASRAHNQAIWHR